MANHALIAGLTLGLILSTTSATLAAQADMLGSDGKPVGKVTLSQTPHGVLLKAELSGLPTGGHGFHIHENGNCAPDFTAAGGHYNPAGKGHGLTQENGMHAGDMPNIHVAADGTVTAEVLNWQVSLDAGANSVFDADGSAIIVHAKPDTHLADAGAGGRIACGVIAK
jgi:Cu-Zn family superoxide dismutase